MFDSSLCEICLTIWGERAKLPIIWTAYKNEPAPIIAIKNAKVSSFGGTSLTLQSNSQIEINPDIPDAHYLYRWRKSHSEDPDIHLTPKTY